MGDRGKAHLGAEGSKEHMLVYKETVNGKFHILMDLDELRGDLDNTLLFALAIPSNGVPLHLDDRTAPDHFSSLDIINGDIGSRDSSGSYNCSEVCSRGINELLIELSCLDCPGNLALAKQLHVVFNSLHKTKLAQLLRVTNMQTTGVNFKEEVWQTVGTPVNDKGSANLTVICHPIAFDEVLEANYVGNCLL